MTIKEIAKMAKVSPGTVDRVIHKRGGVSKKTEEIILKILDEHNFERNVIASTLAKKKRFLIAALIPSAESERDFWHKPMQGIQEAWKDIRDYGFRIESYYFDQFDQDSFHLAFNSMIASKPDGVILAPLFHKKQKQLCKDLDKAGIPYFFINIDIEGMHNLSYVGQDAKKAGQLGAKLMHLLLRDKLDILIVRKERKITDHHALEDRLSGFRKYFDEKKLNASIHELELRSEKQNDMGSLTKLSLKNPQINGIFVPSSFVNIIAKFINEYELYHIKLIGFDIYEESIDYLKTEIIDFLITQKPFEQGYRAVKSMSDFLLFGTEPVKKQFAPIKIITKENVDFHQWYEVR